jgi:two-component system cell cycle sensor histidine kinase/response regulator CckA
MGWMGLTPNERHSEQPTSAPVGASSAIRSANFRVLFAANPLPMWVYDLETHAFLEVNDAAVAKYGYSRDEFLRMRITDIGPPEDIPALLANVAQQRTALQQSGHWRHRLKSGQLIDVEISSRTLRFAKRAAALVVAQDVTERLRAERDLLAHEARKAGMLEAALDAIVAIDHNGSITDFNPAAERIFGYRAEAVRGRPLAETIIPPSLRDRHQTAFDRYLQTEQPTILGRRLELIGLHADGHEFPVELTVYRVPIEGPPVFSAFIRDLTQARQLEEQLVQAQKMESVGRLAGGIAHDFNNLLTAINGFAQLTLDDPQLSAVARDALVQISAAADRASELTSQLLAFSRRQVMQPISLHPGIKVDDIAPMLRRLLGEDIELITRAAPDLGHVLVDPGQLTQVILNLAVNARDAMPRGGTLTIEAENVDLDANYAAGHAEVIPGQYVVLSVTDSGVGMDEATRARLFEPFFTTKELGKGTGLGLATVYGIIKQSGGHIWAYSEPDHGTVFKIYLPRVDAPVEAPVEARGAGEPSRGAETVLVVEDDLAVRRLVQIVLQRRGYRVIAAASATDALERLASPDQRIDLLITDIVMPGMSGVELAKRAADLLPGLKVLFASGYTEDTIVHHGMLDPGVPFLQKPFAPNQLAERVRAELDA